MRERNEALDCYVYARAAAAASGLDRFEERHWQELERQLLDRQDGPSVTALQLQSSPVARDAPDKTLFAVALPGEATPPKRTVRRVIRSSWLRR